jgi:hypothetical protein
MRIQNVNAGTDRTERYLPSFIKPKTSRCIWQLSPTLGPTRPLSANQAPPPTVQFPFPISFKPDLRSPLSHPTSITLFLAATLSSPLHLLFASHHLIS